MSETIRKLNLTMVLSEGFLATPLGKVSVQLPASLDEDKFVREIAKKSVEFAKHYIENTERELAEEYGENWRDL